jgi:hypothetical protein
MNNIKYIYSNDSAIKHLKLSLIRFILINYSFKEASIINFIGINNNCDIMKNSIIERFKK